MVVQSISYTEIKIAYVVTPIIQFQAKNENVYYNCTDIETEHAEYLMKHAKDERSPSAGRGGRLVNDFHGGVYILPEEAADKINR